MQINGEILFFLSAIGAFNALLLALYFFIAKPSSLAKRFLALMLLMISIRILKSVWFFFHPEVTKTFLQVGLSACFLIGPFLYFYCLSATNKMAQVVIPWQTHLSALLLLTIGFNVLYPYQDYLWLWQNRVYSIVNYVWLLYSVLSVKVIWYKFRQLFDDKVIRSNDDILLISVFSGNAIIWFAYFSSSYTSYIVGAISFSFIFYLVCLLLIFRWREQQAQLGKKYQLKKISQSQVQSLQENLEQLMTQQELFRDANLTQPQVAKKLEVSVPLLSQMLNDNLNKSFSVYINEHRISAAKELLRSNKPMKMDDISEQCGFNSQSTFYSAFKKIENSKPAKFRRQFSSNTSEIIN
ncbi:MAG: AraC family transcriptional regulator [Alteromonadaceae bacterium]|nr:AraC family transcriptional regulator [Alteromonadaceae bacterium]